jgi:hypothetical protein
VVSAVGLGAWAVAAPAGSSPDEEYHLVSIWCGQGNDAAHCRADTAADNGSLDAKQLAARCKPFKGISDPGICRRATATPGKLVPPDLLRSRCYAFLPNDGAACQGRDFGTDPTPDFPTDRGNFDGAYPPVYYAAMHTLVGDDVNSSVVRMRVANIVLFLGIVTALGALVGRTLRKPLVWGLLFSSVPFGIWLVSSINPSTWAVTSAGTLWVSLYALADATGRRSVALAGLAIFSALLGSGARADGCLFTLMAIALVALMRLRGSSRTFWATSIASALVAVFFFLRAGQSSATVDALGTGFSAIRVLPYSWSQLLWSHLQSIPSLWYGAFGSAPIGWGDTSLAPSVLFGSLLAWVAVVYTGWASMNRTKALSIALVGLALLVFPLYLLTRSKLVVGEGLGPRYLLPMIIILTGISLLTVSRPAVRLTRMQLATVVGGLSVANAFALHTQMRRYLTGTDVVGFNLNRDTEWWWGGSVPPMAVWAIGSLAFTLTCVLVVSVTVRDEAQMDADDAADGPGTRADQARGADQPGDADESRKPGLRSGRRRASRAPVTP